MRFKQTTQIAILREDYCHFASVHVHFALSVQRYTSVTCNVNFVMELVEKSILYEQENNLHMTITWTHDVT